MIKIIVGDYSAKKKESLLARCQKIRSKYDGFLHAGIIHYIQGEMPFFIPKGMIARVLDKCPSVWSEDLPEQIKAGKDPPITKAMKKEYIELQKDFMVPISGDEIVEIIRLAKKFIKENKKRRHI